MNSPDSPLIRSRNPFDRRTHEAIASGKPRPIGGSFRVLPGNTSFDSRSRSSRSAESGVLIVRNDGTVIPGTVCGLTPTIQVESSDVPISSVPAPALVISSTGTRHVVMNFYVTLTKSADDEFVRNASFDDIKLTVENTAPTAADLNSDGSGTIQFKVLLATFVDGVKTLQAYKQSLWFRVCDDGSRTGSCDLEMTNGPP